MDTAKVTKRYGGSAAAIMEAAGLIGDGMKNEELGASIVERMPPTFPTDYAANAAALVKAIKDQADAAGALNLATSRKREARSACGHHTGTARNLAKRSLAGETELLHSSFTVGSHRFQALQDVLARAEKVHAGCLTYAEKLEARGWPATATTNLAAAIAALTEADSAHNLARQAKKRATDTVVTLANSMYDLIRSVQIVADAEYPASAAATNALIREARGLFLLGVFPPRRSKKPVADPVPTNPPPASSGTPTSPTS